MDQHNPTSFDCHTSVVCLPGPGGFDTWPLLGYEVRDVHYTTMVGYAIDETPEGPNIGLINIHMDIWTNMASFKHHIP